MEVEEIQTQSCKFPRVGNGTSRNIDSAKSGPKIGDHQYPDDEEDGGQHKHSMSITTAAAVGIGPAGSDTNRLRGWPNSRIIRVSRSSGGKDRHSKVLTSKGLRDRRVRLSVATAIQFYDIQDRLGYDQPSKAVEWLIRAASDSIAELPSLNGSFPDTPQQFSDEKRASDGGTEQEHAFDSAEVELDGDSNFHQQQQQNQNLSLSKSACSSNSENSKGSGLSLSRSELRVNRVKARERARERTAKEKKTNNQNLNPISQNSSFTELLTGAISTGNDNTTTTNTTTIATSTSSPSGSSQANLFHKAAGRQWSSMTMEYFTSGLLGAQFSRGHPHHTSGGFPGQIQMGNNTNSLPQAMQVPAFTISTESGGGGSHHQELPHFSLVPDHLIPVAAATSTSQPEYNLNFSITSTSSSSGLGGFNRGTLQSNSSSPSLLPHHLQRFTSPVDGTSMPFLLGTAMPVAVETIHHHQNHHIAQFQSGIDGRLQLCYSDGARHAATATAAAAASHHKGKTRN